jgi:hypothetical protein
VTRMCVLEVVGMAHCALPVFDVFNFRLTP